MSYPAPPPDLKLRDIIEKTAATVATNGTVFEQFIIGKERGNPNFLFLLKNGIYNDYYEYRKRIEAQNAASKQQQQPAVAPPNPLKPKLDFDAIEKQVGVLKAQVAESEKNIAAQRIALTQSSELQLEKLYISNEKQKIDKFIQESFLNITGLDEILNQNSFATPVISRGKQWILETCTTDRQKEVALLYLLFRTKTSSLDSEIRLLIVYIADELASFSKKRLPPLCSTIGRYIPKFFAYASESRIPNIKDKLSKCLKYWERENLFDDKCLQQVRDPQKTLTVERNIEVAERTRLKTQLDYDIQTKISGYEKQHSDYAAHVNAQIVALEATMANERRRILMLTAPKEVAPTVPYYSLPAGVLVNMIKPEDFNYKPLKVADIRVPSMLTPTERLTTQIARFYTVMPESALDEDGWENDGLKPFYAVKDTAKKQMEAALAAEGKKLEDIYTNRYKSPSPEPIRRKTKFDIKPKEAPPSRPPASSQFSYSYDDTPKEKSSTNDKHSSSTYDDDDGVPDYSRRGDGSSRSSQAPPLFSKPISFSLGASRK